MAYLRIPSYMVWCYGAGLPSEKYTGLEAHIRVDPRPNIAVHLSFYSDGVELPPARMEATSSGKSYYVSYRQHQFPWVIDLLRNEGPVFFNTFTNESGLGFLVTSLEEQGEGEA